MDKDFEILKQHWQALCETLGRPDSADLNKARSQSKVQKLVRFYRFLFLLGLCWIVLSPLVLTYVGMPIIMGLICSLYFAIMSVMSYMMMCRVEEIDYSTMSVRELLQAIRSAMRLKKMQQISGMCLMVPLMCYMLYSFHMVNIWIFYGGVAGLILGLTIGLCMDYRVRRTFRQLEAELSEE